MREPATLVSLMQSTSAEKSLISPVAPLKPHVPVVYILEPTPIAGNTQAHASITLSNEYGKSSTCEDLMKLLLDTLGYVRVEILRMNLNNISSLLDSVLQQCPDRQCVVVNLCDGCETDGYPGLTVLKELQKRQLHFTGATVDFYEITTSKPVLKRYLQEQNVPTSPFLEITANTSEADIDALGGYPLIVKPSISYASISISDKSVVFNAKETLAQSLAIQGVDEGVFVERFLSGKEFTAFVMNGTDGIVRVHTVAERVFNKKLKEHQRILAFDRYWDGYDLEGNTPDPTVNEPVYWYAQAQADLQPLLQDIARRAYIAVKGSGYGRVDMRTPSMDSNEVFVLEVNANCGVSFNVKESTSSVAEILRMSKESIPSFVDELIGFGFYRGSL